MEPVEAASDALYHRWMGWALAQAAHAAAVGEVPVGAVVVYQDEVLVQAHNLRELTADPLGHAEILALRAAAQRLKRWRLTGCTLVVTLEPCAMCAGALVNARLDRVVFGAADPRSGAVGSLMNIPEDQRLNHTLHVVAGIRCEESVKLLQTFFSARRAMKSENRFGIKPKRFS